MRRPARSSGGFALLAVLWCLGIMTVGVMGLVGFVSLQLDESVSQAKDFRARQLALSGLAIGLHPLVDRHDPLLDTVGESTPMGYRVTLTGENGRLNVNALLRSGRTDVLERLWTGWGLNVDAAKALDDCLLDWIDADDLQRLNGAEHDDYVKLGHPEYPPNRPFQSIDEIGEVAGFGLVAKLKPAWRDSFTLWSDGKLDLNEAPADLIAAVCDVGEAQAQAFVRQRDPNGKVGDAEGHRWKSVQDASSFLGMSRDAQARAASLLSVESSIWRIESVGVVDNHKHTIQAVTQRNGGEPNYYLWEEF